MLTDLQSAIWTRLFAEDPHSVVCDKVLPLIQEKFGINRIVIGHTPQEDHMMKSRCGGKIFLTDCGMIRWLFNDEGMPGLLVLRVGTDIDDFQTITSIYYDPWTSRVKVQTRVPPVTVNGDISALLDPQTNKRALPKFLSNISGLMFTSDSNYVFRAIYQENSDSDVSDFYGVVDCYPPNHFDRLRDRMKAHDAAITHPPHWDPVEVSHVKINGIIYSCMLMSVPDSVNPVPDTIRPQMALEIRKAVRAMHVLGVTMGTSHIADIQDMFGYDDETRDVHLI